MPAQTLHALLRRTQQEKVLHALRAGGPQSRAQLSDATGISRSTLSELTAALLDQHHIVVADAGHARRRGRPAERLALNPSAGQLMGVDFGHQRVHVVLVDAAHELIASTARPYAASTPWTDRVVSAFALIDEVAAAEHVDIAALDGVGIGFPGPFSPRMPAAVGPDGEGESPSASEYVRSAFTDRFDTPVMLDNNTRFAGLAEAIWGRGANVTDLVYVRLSHGVGGGLVVNGRLVTGSTGFAGELGHVSVRPDGLDCRCGKRGCLETIASVPAILDACARQGVHLDSLDALASAVDKADPLVDRVLRTAGEALGQVLGTMAVTLNPAEIVVGGEIVHRAPTLLKQAEATIGWELLPVREATPTVRASALGDEDGALGAVAALFHQSRLLENYPDAATATPTAAGRERSVS